MTGKSWTGRLLKGDRFFIGRLVALLAAMKSFYLPPTDRKTVQAAEAAFGKRNSYLVIGASVDKLYLSPFSPGLPPSALCDFRRRLLTNDSHQALFDHLLERLGRDYPFPASSLPSGNCRVLLETICTWTHLEFVTLAMERAIQALATGYGEWLCSIVRSHWFSRYPRDRSMIQLPADLETLLKLAESIGEDGRYLMKAITEGDSNLRRLAEIQALEQAWACHFEMRDEGYRWQPPNCTSCMSRGLSWRTI